MIKPLVSTVFALLATLAIAQGGAAGNDLHTEKASLMYAALQLDAEQSEKFWPIYREYEARLDQLIERRLELLRLYAGNYKIMTDDKAEILARNAFELSKSRTKLREDYYKKFARALNPIIAVRFAQVDKQIDTLLDVEILRLVPLIATPEELGLKPTAD